MSIANNRFLRIDPRTGAVVADSPGPLPDGSDGVRFVWSHAGANAVRQIDADDAVVRAPEPLALP